MTIDTGICLVALVVAIWLTGRWIKRLHKLQRDVNENMRVFMQSQVVVDDHVMNRLSWSLERIGQLENLIVDMKRSTASQVDSHDGSTSQQEQLTWATGKGDPEC